MERVNPTNDRRCPKFCGCLSPSTPDQVTDSASELEAQTDGRVDAGSLKKAAGESIRGL
jgi:hypothetical protein